MLSLARVAVIASTLCGLAAADKLADHSFEPPFAEVDNAGTKLVNKNWKSGGVAVVNSNFVRLTPDRQSKKGSLWSKKPLGVDSFSAILKFRISGQGKSFFGDGIGFWITQSSYWREGDMHAVNDKFVGVGIVFDTFKNTENLAAHRDVTVIVNDGEKNWEMMTADVQGCQASLRYHNDRADFSVTDSSRAKVVLENKRLTVFVDENNSGEWHECVSIADIGLPDYWSRRAHLGLSASTGQLADNHDVISLVTYSDSDHAVIEAHEQVAASKKLFEFGMDLSEHERFLRIETAINDIMTKMDMFDHHVEHELASVEDHISNLLSKIEKREDKSENRIELIEENIRTNIEGALRQRLTSVEVQMKNMMDSKINKMSNEMNEKMVTSIRDASSDSGGWKLPFIIILVLLFGAAVGLYLFYRHLKKTHLL